MIRLDKFLSQMNIGTRSEVKSAIRKGKVTVNGKVCKSADIKIDENSDKVCFEDKEVVFESFVYYMLNKPAGVLSATTDKREKTVIDLIDTGRKDLFPVGRLDKDTEGLLLITNDGKLAHELLSPRKHVGKTYMAHITGSLPDNAIERFQNGLEVDEEFVALPAVLEILGTPDSEKEYPGKSVVMEKRKLGKLVTTVYVTIQEGKFHQVKRMFQAVGCEVIYLRRIQMGPLLLDESLQPGEYKVLSKEIVECLKNLNQ